MATRGERTPHTALTYYYDAEDDSDEEIAEDDPSPRCDWRSRFENAVLDDDDDSDGEFESGAAGKENEDPNSLKSEKRRGLIDDIRGLWTNLEDAVVRPPRCIYEKKDLLGPYFSISGLRCRRDDFIVKNTRGLLLHVSHFVCRDFVARRDSSARGRQRQLPPCVVYLHGNSGSRMDAHQAAIHLLQQDISVCAFDFSGSGLSEGTYVTLGQNEVGDVESVVAHLRETGRADRIGLWGRSMGATTSLMFARKNPSLVGIVLDSPFSKLHSLLFEIATQYKITIKKFFLRIAIWVLGRTLKRRAGVEIGKLDVSKSVAQTFVPALFVHGGQDNFVDKRHSEILHERYGGDTNLVIFEGDHNSARPDYVYDSISIFFANIFFDERFCAAEDRHDTHDFSEGEMSTRMLARSAKKGTVMSSAAWTPTSRRTSLSDVADAMHAHCGLGSLDAAGGDPEFFDFLEADGKETNGSGGYASDGCSSSSSYADASDNL